MVTFDVTYERVNDFEAAHGGTTRYGFLDEGLTLHDAIAAVRQDMPSASESRGSYASGSPHQYARWFSVENNEWESGDSVTYSIHFPENTTNASRTRLCRVLARELWYV